MNPSVYRNEKVFINALFFCVCVCINCLLIDKTGKSVTVFTRLEMGLAQDHTAWW